MGQIKYFYSYITQAKFIKNIIILIIFTHDWSKFIFLNKELELYTIL